MATTGFTDATEQGLLDYFIATYGAAAASKGLGLLTGTVSSDAGGGLTEVTGSAYARIALPAFGSASGTAPASVSNTGTGTFPTAGGSWSSGANVTHFGIYTNQTAGSGTLLAVIPLTTPKAFTTGDTPTVAAAALKLQLGDVGDTFG